MNKYKKYQDIIYNINRFPEDIGNEIYKKWFDEMGNKLLFEVNVKGSYELYKNAETRYNTYFSILFDHYDKIIKSMTIEDHIILKHVLERIYVNFINQHKQYIRINTDSIIYNFCYWIDYSNSWKEIHETTYNVYLNALNLSLL